MRFAICVPIHVKNQNAYSRKSPKMATINMDCHTFVVFCTAVEKGPIETGRLMLQKDECGTNSGIGTGITRTS